MRGLRITVIIGIMVVVIGLLFGGQWMYTRYFFEKPIGNVLDQVEGVESVDYDKEAGTLSVSLTQVPDLRDTFLNIEDGLQSQGGFDGVRVRLVDNRSRFLEDVYYQMHFAIFQSIFTGEFVSMQQTINSIAADYGLDEAAVYVDSVNVYLQLHRGDEYLYEVIPRRDVRAPGEAVDGSGDR